MPPQKVGEFTYSLQMMLHEIHLILCEAETLFPGALPRAFVERLLWRYTEEVGWG